MLVTCPDPSDSGWVLQVGVSVLTVVLGGLGYLVAEFWFGPIRRFLDLRRQIAADLIFYANAITPYGEGREHHAGDPVVQERLAANRRVAADLQAGIKDLPRWYLWWVSCRRWSPDVAASELLALSNVSEIGNGQRRMAAIQRALGLGFIVVTKAESDKLLSQGG